MFMRALTIDLGMVRVVDPRPTIERLTRKKYSGVCKWMLRAIKVMMKDFPQG